MGKYSAPEDLFAKDFDIKLLRRFLKAIARPFLILTILASINFINLFPIII